jgi:hypothetical protein
MYEQDAAWLDRYCITHNLDAPTEAQIEQFCEKVATCWADAGMSDSEARSMAVGELFKKDQT